MSKNTPGRIEIPKNPNDLSILAESIYQKHRADGDTSPLRLLNDFNWDNTGPKVAILKAKHAEAERLRAQMEALYRERDLLVAEIAPIVRASASVLKAIYKKNPKRIGDWGFKVDDTPAS